MTALFFFQVIVIGVLFVGSIALVISVYFRVNK